MGLVCTQWAPSSARLNTKPLSILKAEDLGTETNLFLFLIRTHVQFFFSFLIQTQSKDEKHSNFKASVMLL